ncbi:hypothetical protein FWG86_00305 [Candidatus Saccharibacteria bacterium]|nr:hypothetical protein [Candidatus Saccharibacteria bacterium]
MSIFESRSQVFWRKVREGLGRFFGKIGAWFGRMRGEFRELPKNVRTVIYMGGSVLAVLLLFSIVIWPRLQRPEPEPEGPQRETVAEAIERLTAETRRPLLADEVPEIIEDIDEQVNMSEDKSELLELYSLRGRVFFNAMMYHRSAESYLLILERELIEDGRYFDVYSALFYAYTHADDPAAASQWAARTVEEYLKGYIEDDGGCVTYAQAAGIEISTCPSIFDARNM